MAGYIGGGIAGDWTGGKIAAWLFDAAAQDYYNKISNARGY
jgi:hypothetical protein